MHFTVDTVASSLSVRQDEAGPGILNLSVRAEPDSQVTITGSDSSLVHDLDGAGSWDEVQFELAPGAHQVTVRAVDAAGNETTEELNVEVTRSMAPAFLTASASALAAAGVGIGVRRRRARSS